ncbi:MAG: hypothetical protein IPQ09_31070 [Myxococcales bacterium]|nr:hypothetical protein [Myxococcales bacterium]MBL0198584.1 hypothetical protein [Myxococcales bacterium]
MTAILLSVLSALESVVELIRESGTEAEREALFVATERLASIHARAKFAALREDT